MAQFDLRCGCRVVGDLSAPEATVAAAELEQALGRAGNGAVEILMSHGTGPGDGFRRRAMDQRIELIGDSPRALLFATYSMLEELGLRWPWPGKRPGVPERAGLDGRELVHAPRLPGRCLVLGERELLEHAEEWIVWAARNRLNSLFIHVSTRHDPVGAAPEELWLEQRAHAIRLGRERGMTIEHGGHLLPELLPRNEIRALAEGRMPTDATREILYEHVRTHPEADVLHLWGADLPPGARGRDAADAALRTANTVAALADDVRPGTQVAFLAYHDTEEVPSGVRPRGNVCLVFAPRERCYRHALHDPDCPRNKRYRDLLLAHVDHFRSANAARPRVFEYWFDAIRFPDGVPDLTATMNPDLDFYRAAGVHTVQMLMTGHGRAPPPHPNPMAFPRLAWGLPN